MNQSSHKQICKAVKILKNGGIVIYPTETVYGIGCDPFDKDACKKVQRLKNCKDNKTLLLIAWSHSQVEEFAGRLKGDALRLAQIFWPGPLTMVFKPSKDIPDYLLGRTGGVAFRVTSNPVAALLVETFGCPITSTSANLTGQSPLKTFKEIKNLFGENADIILASNEPLHGKPSTVVDLTSKHLAIIREGSITLSRIQEVL